MGFVFTVGRFIASFILKVATAVLHRFLVFLAFTDQHPRLVYFSFRLHMLLVFAYFPFSFTFLVPFRFIFRFLFLFSRRLFFFPLFSYLLSSSISFCYLFSWFPLTRTYQYQVLTTCYLLLRSFCFSFLCPSSSRFLAFRDVHHWVISSRFVFFLDGRRPPAVSQSVSRTRSVLSFGQTRPARQRGGSHD